ncbi:MAG: FAD-dependent oxidoreductase [Deltaproteobacteria bacterium]|nr:MAG: FAD-dependent oxidoreductase [Deltaproteobacteria bacterium]
MPPLTATTDVAIVGAGLAGAACARRLHELGLGVLIVDKGRRPGGRLATRVESHGTYDHGCQHFTASSEAFRERIDQLVDTGSAAVLTTPTYALHAGDRRPVTASVPRYVGVPGNSAVVEAELHGLHDSGNVSVHCGVRVNQCRRSEGRWHLDTGDGHDLPAARALVVTVPAPQLPPLIGATHPIARRAATIRTSACWTLLMALDQRLDLPFDLAFIDGSALTWAAREPSRPGRSGKERWTLHATAEWSEEHLEGDPQDVSRMLLAAFSRDVARLPGSPAALVAHRWRHAFVENPLTDGAFLDDERHLAACGDWCLLGNVEGAWRSGRLAAEKVAALLARD